MSYYDDERENEFDRLAKKIEASVDKAKATRAFASAADSFDDSRKLHACAQDLVADFLKQHCNVRRRASLPLGPRRSPAQGGSHA